MEELIKLPLWKACLNDMRETGFTYGSSWQVEYFEERLRCKRDEPKFSFEMLELKRALENEDGYYLRSSDSGAKWDIPVAIGHEDVASGLDAKLRRCAVRSINIRSATLMNPKAELTDCERKRVENNLEKASVRLVLISRQKSVMNVLAEHSPKLLELKQ